MAERITYKTDDEVTIVADWTAAPTTIGAVILLHMMPANRLSWAGFQGVLAKRGIASLALDLRGHGESTAGPEGATLDYKKFTDEEHQSSLFDVSGAFAWLRRRGFEGPRIALCGASIGANLALQQLLDEPQISGAALLSPGRDYHGTKAQDDVGGVLPHQSLWVAASEGDDQQSFDAAKELHDAAPVDRKTLVPLRNAGHGTAMLTAHPEVAEALADWLRDTIQGT